MSSYNKVILMGNLTRDPELKQAGRTSVCDLALAVNEKYKTKDGEQRENTVYVDVIVWARRAEVCAEHLKKGSGVHVDGRLQLDKWETDGQKRSKLRVRADSVQFLPSGKGEASPNAGGAEGVDTGASKADLDGLGDETEDDQPF